MANPEHLEILKHGVDVWNRWREEKPAIRPNLDGADLSKMNLRKVNFNKTILQRTYLTEADLTEADLNGANLSNAVLIKSILIKADLSRAILHGAILQGANLDMATLDFADFQEADLWAANLHDAKLRKANLVRAHLREVNFERAELSGANLSDAKLTGANLTFTKLNNANLSGVDLKETVLLEAHLGGADFGTATIGYTTLGMVDLSNVVGLDTVEHDGPSEIGIHTIFRSGGNIPVKFLQGAGISDTFITYIASLTKEAIQYYSCFISYSTRDEVFAQRLHADLQHRGIRCWYAPKDMKTGDKIRSSIDQSIRIHDKLLIILSENSLTSFWVESEVEKAFEEEHQRGQLVLFPVRLDEAVMKTDKPWAAEIRRTRHIGDFSRWKDHDVYQRAFDRLLRDLRAES